MGAIAPYKYNEADIVDLDAARSEALGKPFRLSGHVFVLPPQLPAAVLDPLFDGQLDDIIGLVVDTIAQADIANPQNTDLTEVLERLRSNPLIVPEALKAAVAVFEGLLGPEQWVTWRACSPAIVDYLTVAKLAWRQYGVGLGEALGLSSSFDAGGATSKPTSPRTASMRAGSGSRKAIQT